MASPHIFFSYKACSSARRAKNLVPKTVLFFRLGLFFDCPAGLRLLSELSVLGTISAVAETVHLTRTAVSQQLNLLEKELNVSLCRVPF